MPGGIRNRLLLIFLAVLVITALIEFITLGLVRRTFVFYTVDNGTVIVEQRMLASSKRGAASKNLVRSASREIDIIRYVEEALLGPVTPDSLPLFPKETRLLSLLYRDGVVYADLSEDAALPPVEGVSVQSGDVLRGFITLHSGMKRNFPYIRDIRFFIAGKAAYPDQFRGAGELPLKNEI